MHLNDPFERETMNFLNMREDFIIGEDSDVTIFSISLISYASGLKIYMNLFLTIISNSALESSPEEKYVKRKYAETKIHNNSLNVDIDTHRKVSEGCS